MTTVRFACESPLAKFSWPSQKVDFNKQLSIALHHLPPAHFITIANRFKMTDEFKRARNCGDVVYEKSPDEYVEVFHGTSPFALPQILSQGIKGSPCGSGWEEIAQVYGQRTHGVRLEEILDCGLLSR